MDDYLVEKIKENENLKRLLYDKDISSITIFKKHDYEDAVFKEQIKGLYWDSFQHIYETNITQERYGKVSALIKSTEALATREIKDKIVARYLIKSLDNLLELLGVIRNEISEGKKVSSIKNDQFDKALNNALVSTLNVFGNHPLIKERKEQILNEWIYILVTLDANYLGINHSFNEIRQSIIKKAKWVRNKGKIQQHFVQYYKSDLQAAEEIFGKRTLYRIGITLLVAILVSVFKCAIG